MHMTQTLTEAQDLLQRVIQCDPEMVKKSGAITQQIVEDSIKIDVADQVMVDEAISVEDDVIQMCTQTNEQSMLSCQVQPSSIYFRNLLDVENQSVFYIRNKNIVALNKESNTLKTLGACQYYHARLVVLPGQNSCLVIGGSADIEGLKPIDKVY